MALIPPYSPTVSIGQFLSVGSPSLLGLRPAGSWPCRVTVGGRSLFLMPLFWAARPDCAQGGPGHLGEPPPAVPPAGPRTSHSCAVFVHSPLSNLVREAVAVLPHAIKIATWDPTKGDTRWRLRRQNQISPIVQFESAIKPFCWFRTEFGYTNSQWQTKQNPRHSCHNQKDAIVRTLAIKS